MTPRETYEKELAKVAKVTGLTEKQVENLSRTMNSTWQEIGADYLLCSDVGYSSGRSIPRSHVVEAVTDADRLKSHALDRGGCRGYKEDEKEQLLAAIELYYKMDTRKRNAINKFAFPYKRYGW